MVFHRFLFTFSLFALYSPWVGVDAQPAGRAIVQVKFGYFPEARPSHAACARGWFDLDLSETNTFYRVTCYPQTSGAYAASRLDNLQLDLASLGSTPWAQAAARGVDATLVYVSHYMGDSQGLYVRPEEPERNYSRIVTPYDLEGRSVGVPFGSTMHYQILFLIDLLGLEGKVNLLDMAPSEIMQAWDDPKRDPPIIDAAGCWGVARQYLLSPRGVQNGAVTLISAGLLADWGRPTFTVVAATRTFAKSHPRFMNHFVGVMSRIDDSYLDRLGQNDPLNIMRWDTQRPVNSSYVPSMTDALMLPNELPSAPSVDSRYRERRELDMFIQKSSKDQTSCNYVGPGPGQCEHPTLLHQATIQTAEFLLDQKILARLGPLDRRPDCSDTSSFCGSDILNGEYLAMARRDCSACLPVGRYAASVGPVPSSSKNGDPDLLLSTLEEWDRTSRRLGYAPAEVGRLGGDSTCGGQQIIGGATGSPIVDQFGDGANAQPGKSYSEDLYCEWTIRGTDCDSPDSACQFRVEISFEELRLWSADFVTIYSDPDMNCNSASSSLVLLGQFSGFLLPPPVRAVGCLLVVFETDSNQERSYGSNNGDGFVVQYNRASVGCSDVSDCGGDLYDDDVRCEFNGLCECGGQRWGADCSGTQACFGVSRVLLGDGTSHVIKSSTNLEPRTFQKSDLSDMRALNPIEAYPNDLDCTFELVFPIDYQFEQSFIRVSIFYDLEPTYDMLWLKKGAKTSTGEPETYAVLTGNHRTKGQPEEYIIPVKDRSATLHLTTDSVGRRRGFYATVQAIRNDEGIHAFQNDGCSVLGKSGYLCEFEHCIRDNKLAPAQYGHQSGPYVLGSVVSQNQQTRTEPVPALPWAPEGGCAWNLLPNGLPNGADNAVALRLVFNSPLDLEPHPVNSVGDKLIIRQLMGSELMDTELFVEKCDSEEVCSYPWQTGVCGENGGCVVKTSVQIPLTSSGANTDSSPSALLVTDRNDGGQYYNGLNFDVLLVKECPAGDTPCEQAPGGQCVDGFCYCGDVACSCPCDGSTSMSTGVKVGIVVGVVLVIVFVFLLIFLMYRHRKIKKSRVQKSIIKEKDEELDAFRDSVVGMRTAIKTYVPSLSANKGPKRKQEQPKVSNDCIWCWKETDFQMMNHSQDTIFGDPADCWIKYSDDDACKLESAFVFQKGAGEFSPVDGYVVSFDNMTQTKEATGYQREVKRVPGKAITTPLPKLDVSVEAGEKFPDDLALAEEPQMVLVEGDVVQLSKQRQDGWAFGTKLQHADEPLSRQLVQAAIGDTGADDSAILTDTGWFKLDATRVPSGEDLAALHSRVGQTGLDPPKYWDKIVDPTVVQQHVLPKDSDERNAVVKAFRSTLPGKVRVVRVQRLQNLAMWQSYLVKRQTICYREAGKAGDAADADVVTKKALERFERRWLWHGTNVEVMDKIIQQGFNRSFCGKNATMFGKGVYFARDASYSSSRTYSVPDRNGTQYMMACRVVVGEYCPGVQDALTPDLRDSNKNILYDTTVGLLYNDTLANPSIYVTYHDAQAYPEYLIAFKTI